MKKSISLLLIFTMLTGLFIAYANNDIIPVNTDENVITEQQLTNSDEADNSSDAENNIPEKDIKSENESEKENGNTQNENVNTNNESSDLTDSTEKTDGAKNGDNKENSENAETGANTTITSNEESLKNSEKVENDENTAGTGSNNNTEKSENTENTEVIEKPENSDNTDNIEADIKTEVNTEQTSKEDNITVDDKTPASVENKDNNTSNKITKEIITEALKGTGFSYDEVYFDKEKSIKKYGRYIDTDNILYAVSQLKGTFRDAYWDYKIINQAKFKVTLPDTDLSSNDEAEIHIYNIQRTKSGKPLKSFYLICVKGNLKEKWFVDERTIVRRAEGMFYSSDGILGDDESIISLFGSIERFYGDYYELAISENAQNESMTVYYNFNDSSKTVMNSITVSYDGYRVTVPIEEVDYTGNFLGTFLYMMYPDQKIYTELCKKLGIMP